MSLKIDISSQLAAFKKHLQIPNNTRILFSGPFGSGKSYFIERFFEENEEEYIKIKVNPVHYSVASNEDIFELIKYDILFELLGRPEIETMKVENPLSLVLASFIQSKLDEISKLGMSAIDLVDSTLGKIGLGLLTVSKLAKKFEKYKRSTEKSTQDLIIEYLKTVTKRPGIREEDLTTILLCEVVALVKEKSEKKVVLVIDDLDRIDPEHIFRILNVFGAHFDILKEGNKFDFDHVVLVCDEKNIRNIFRAKYGVDVDYNGYIDKFFSKEIFQFDISDSVFNEVIKFFDLVSAKHGDFEAKKYVYENTIYVIKTLVKYRMLQIRSLLKLSGKDISSVNGGVDYFGNMELYFLVIESYQILGKIFGSLDSLEQALFGLANREVSDNFHYDLDDLQSKNKLRDLLPIIDSRSHRFSRQEFEKQLSIKWENVDIRYTLRLFPESMRQATIVQARDILVSPTNKDVRFFKMFYEVYCILKDDFHVFRT